MLDRSFRTMFRHFGTFFLVAAVVVLPLQLVYAFFFRDVIALAELHDAIRDLPSGRDVRGITGDDIATARATSWVVLAVEILLLPVFARVTQRAVRAEEAGKAEGVLTHWRRPLGAPLAPPLSAAIIVPALSAIVIAVLATTAVTPVAELVPGHLAWVAAGLGTAAAHLLAAPFLLIPWAALKETPPNGRITT